VKVVVVLLVMLGWTGTLNAARAAGADSCTKDCRDFQSACLKAHSHAACKTDYDICVKACRKK